MTPVIPFGECITQHYGSSIHVTRWGTPGLENIQQVRDQVLSQSINYNMAIVFHIWHPDHSVEQFESAQKQIYKHFENIRRPVLHCLHDLAPNTIPKWGNHDFSIVKMLTLTRKSRNYVDQSISVNNIDQPGNWRAAQIIQTFIEQNRIE